MIIMGESFMWIFALLILLFGGNFGGFFGGNRGPIPDQVTQAELQAGLNNVTTQNQLQQLGIATANNNYETALLINQLGGQITNQNNNNLVNAIQGFNALNQSISAVGANLGSKLDQLGFQMENCCCSIKTLIKDNQIADLTNQLNNANNVAINAAQTQTILNTMGKWVANAPAATT
jgi:hypothetical protein